MASKMPSSGATYENSDCITVPFSGDYELNYSAVVIPVTSGTLSLSVRQNGSVIPNSTVKHTVFAYQEVHFNGSIISNLPAGAVIDLVLTSSGVSRVNFSDGVNAVLTLKRLM